MTGHACPAPERVRPAQAWPSSFLPESTAQFGHPVDKNLPDAYSQGMAESNQRVLLPAAVALGLAGGLAVGSVAEAHLLPVHEQHTTYASCMTWGDHGTTPAELSSSYAWADTYQQNCTAYQTGVRMKWQDRNEEPGPGDEHITGQEGWVYESDQFSYQASNYWGIGRARTRVVNSNHYYYNGSSGPVYWDHNY